MCLSTAMLGGNMMGRDMARENVIISRQQLTQTRGNSTNAWTKR